MGLFRNYTSVERIIFSFFTYENLKENTFALFPILHKKIDITIRCPVNFFILEKIYLPNREKMCRLKKLWSKREDSL